MDINVGSFKGTLSQIDFSSSRWSNKEADYPCRRGMHWGLENRLEDLDYADDMIMQSCT